MQERVTLADCFTLGDVTNCILQIELAGGTKTVSLDGGQLDVREIYEASTCKACTILCGLRSGPVRIPCLLQDSHILILLSDGS